MKTLIVYAHPDSEGHCSTILKRIVQYHKENEIDYELLDLYKIKYDAILHEGELYTSGGRGVSEQNKGIQKKITETDKLIFIYPIWWGTMPAILKGFFDRIFTSHFAFKYVNGVPFGMLKGKKSAVFITTGAPELFSTWFQGSRPKKGIKKDILNFCGIKAKVFQVGNATKLTDKQKRKIDFKVKMGMRWLY